MADSSTVEIPDRPVFKAAEVCELVKVQPYVLRTWEAEFPELGEAKATGSGRIYRRDDVARVLKIKHLLLVEGLTLAGARRRMEADDSGEAVAVSAAAATPHVPVQAHTRQPAASVATAPAPSAVSAALAADVRDRIRSVRTGLKSLLDLLDAPESGEAPREFTLEAEEDTPVPVDDEPPRAKSSRGASSKSSASPKRKRSS